ncbi:MAG: cobyric acid synthase [Alphaproteobacteria bacterium]|nr:cobyric acid synthase [Alphaproteobacteria bacterium]
MPAAIMVLGTASNVGKSWLTTALCALARRRGLRVAPFKAQNMSNNAAPARCPDGTWGEIGRAQATQAEAAGLDPRVEMNPILLKPSAEQQSQVVLLGRPLGHMEARRYWGDRGRFREAVEGAYATLAQGRDLMVLEGAGSPVELNLMTNDLVNLSMARHAAAHARASGQPGGCLLVGDIDRGGVFAALLGTLDLMAPADRALVKGLVVNRFRGDPHLFSEGPRILEARGGVPVRGVIPWRPDVYVAPEDGQDIHGMGSGVLDLCVVRLPTVSNFTDVDALATLPPVRLRYVDRAEQVGNPDLLILPGAKNTLADLRWMRARGLDRVVVAAASRGVPVLGLCGGYQLLGARIHDPEGAGGTPGVEPGLGLLPVETRFSLTKRVQPSLGTTCGGWLLPAGLPVEGYEIHQGETVAGAAPLVELADGPDGAAQGLVAGTYLHGLLDTAPARAALIAALLARRGLPAFDGPVVSAAASRARGYEALADLMEEHVDLDGLLP